jgi:Flp pilus assembly CpaE family ATPase
MPALALIRSGGLLLVRAANMGRTVVELYPKERITEDFEALGEKLVGRAPVRQEETPVASLAGAKAAFRIFGRAKDPARA